MLPRYKEVVVVDVDSWKEVQGIGLEEHVEEAIEIKASTELEDGAIIDNGEANKVVEETHIQVTWLQKVVVTFAKGLGTLGNNVGKRRKRIRTGFPRFFEMMVEGLTM